MEKDWLIYTNIEVKDYKQILNNIINQIKPIDLSNKSTRGFNSIQYDLFEKQNLFLEIQEKVSIKIKEYLNNELRLLSAWTVLGQENSYHTVHQHNSPINHLSTVLYLDTPKNPNIHQPGSFYYFLRDENLNIVPYEIHPQIGDLIIMPVHVFHGVYPQSKGLRQTLNMDFEVI